MKRINFQNGITKVNEDTFNAFQNNIEESTVIVSATEPTTNEKVWLKKGKNLLNLIYCKITNINAISQWQKNSITVTSIGGWGNALIEDFEVESGKSYVFSTDYSNSEASNTGIIIYNQNDETLNFQSSTTQNGRFEVSFTANTSKVKIKFSANNTSEVKNNVVTYTNVQLESGSTATSFDEYVEQGIYCKNNDEVWEKFAKENDTGWIDMSAYINTEYFAPRPELPPRARKIGKVVYWMGYVYCIKDSLQWTLQIMRNLPDWARCDSEYARAFVMWETWNYGTMFLEDNHISIGQSTEIKSVGESNWRAYSLATISGYISKGE